MRSLVYAMADAPWEVHVRVQAAGLLLADLAYRRDTATSEEKLRPAATTSSAASWSFPGKPPFQAQDTGQHPLYVQLNADGGAHQPELLFLELQHWEDPLNGTATAQVEVDVQQGGASLGLYESVICPTGKPTHVQHAGPFVFTSPVAWSKTGLFFDWRPAAGGAS